jgi:hypothetical protein
MLFRAGEDVATELEASLKVELRFPKERTVLADEDDGEFGCRGTDPSDAILNLKNALGDGRLAPDATDGACRDDRSIDVLHAALCHLRDDLPRPAGVPHLKSRLAVHSLAAD